MSALENLTISLAKADLLSSVTILLFSVSKNNGAGEIYDLDQVDSNWLNVSTRGLTLPARDEVQWGTMSIPAFPSYHEWVGFNQDDIPDTSADLFPMRSTLGRYLSQRYQSIATPLKERQVLQEINRRVLLTKWQGSGLEILSTHNTVHMADEVVLTIGHQRTFISSDVQEWVTHSQSLAKVDAVVDPYPVSAFTKSANLNKHSRVAIRGFGLAMIDVMRALTIGKGGEFKIVNDSTREMEYLRSGDEPQKIIPYSLDGLPMAPKLVNLKIDRLFFPTDVEKQQLEQDLTNIAEKGQVTDTSFLIGKVVEIAARVYRDLQDKVSDQSLKNDELKSVMESWLKDHDYTHSSIISKNQTTLKTLKAFIDMATGERAYSLDFCVGHVWRHCQPTLYRALSFASFSDELMSAIIALDERMKRYAYGPPVASLQQLYALIKADVVSLDFICDPKICPSDDGWSMTKEGKQTSVNLMVNSVLDPPAIKQVNTLVVKNLFSQSLVRPIDKGLGVDTRKNACVIPPDADNPVPLAILGRLAKGTLLGVDAILECFNYRSEEWSQGVVQRLSANTTK